MSNCVFCRIISGDEPAQILWGGHYAHRALVIVPLNPVVEGHVIALPKQHAEDFTDSWQATSDAMHAAFQYARTVGGDMNLITSKGEAATQTVFHLHVHLVPRRKGDRLKLPWSKPMVADMAACAPIIHTQEPPPRIVPVPVYPEGWIRR